MYLSDSFTQPDHRNQGAAGLLVECGIREADKRGLGGYIEETSLGRKVYERHGYVTMHMADVSFEHPSPTAQWRRVVENMRANPHAIM